jgi:hypothetical protein
MQLLASSRLSPLNWLLCQVTPTEVHIPLFGLHCPQFIFNFNLIIVADRSASLIAKDTQNGSVKEIKVIGRARAHLIARSRLFEPINTEKSLHEQFLAKLTK